MVNRPRLSGVPFTVSSCRKTNRLRWLSVMSGCGTSSNVRRTPGSAAKRRLSVTLRLGVTRTAWRSVPGNQLLDLIAWRDRDTSGAIGRFIIEFRRHGLRSSEIWGDAGGLGHPMIDMLRDAGWPINRVNFGAKARADQLYQNLGTELWSSLSAQIDKGEMTSFSLIRRYSAN